eukprot:gb/GFBE01001080.1/.p1 GENE.gb/GFBE01001080.1/~~gb/GFBE01001080.1/.p1  ORF type:complete len:200 (+),score=47.81 gb/GFBE01001080.1/:1-600(+)
MPAAPVNVAPTAEAVAVLRKADFPDVQRSLRSPPLRPCRGARGLYRDAVLKEWTLCDAVEAADEESELEEEAEWTFCDGTDEDLQQEARLQKPSYADMALQARRPAREEEPNKSAQPEELERGACRSQRERCRDSAFGRRAKKAAKKEAVAASTPVPEKKPQDARSPSVDDGSSTDGFTEVKRKSRRERTATSSLPSDS